MKLSCMNFLVIFTNCGVISLILLIIHNSSTVLCSEEHPYYRDNNLKIQRQGNK